MKRFALILAILTLVVPAAFAGPFGFEYGMTKQQVLAIVGKENVLKDQGFLLRVASAPKPDDRFEAYLLLISEEKGLLKIIATGKTIDTSEFGTELRTNFGTMRDSLAKTYGAPTQSYDSVLPGSRMGAPNAYTEALRLKQRVLACNWDVDAGKRKTAGRESDHIAGVILETKGLRRNAGWLELTYEFEGFTAFYEKMYGPVIDPIEKLKKDSAQAKGKPE